MLLKATLYLFRRSRPRDHASARFQQIEFTDETLGAEPKFLVPVVGIWRIENDAGKRLLAVDGRQWKEGQSSAGIVDKARALYGERYAEFLDRLRCRAHCRKFHG